MKKEMVPHALLRRLTSCNDCLAFCASWQLMSTEQEVPSRLRLCGSAR
jgi:hypothetical protein